VAGSPMAGRKASEETKIKQSNSLKGRRKNPRPFCKCGELVKEHYTKSGRFHSYYKTCGNIECMKHFIPCSEEKKKKISEAQIRVGNKPSFKGFNHSAETKRRLSEASKIISLGRKHSEETKEKLRQIQKGNTNGTGPRSKEFKEKMSQLMKGNKNGCKK
jgi:hypothetical protein